MHRRKVFETTSPDAPFIRRITLKTGANSSGNGLVHAQAQGLEALAHVTELQTQTSHSQSFASWQAGHASTRAFIARPLSETHKNLRQTVFTGARSWALRKTVRCASSWAGQKRRNEAEAFCAFNFTCTNGKSYIESRSIAPLLL